MLAGLPRSSECQYGSYFSKHLTLQAIIKPLPASTPVQSVPGLSLFTTRNRAANHYQRLPTVQFVNLPVLGSAMYGQLGDLSTCAGKTQILRSPAEQLVKNQSHVNCSVPSSHYTLVVPHTSMYPLPACSARCTPHLFQSCTDNPHLNPSSVKPLRLPQYQRCGNMPYEYALFARVCMRL